MGKDVKEYSISMEFEYSGVECQRGMPKRGMMGALSGKRAHPGWT
jgi:hypothetical protein